MSDGMTSRERVAAALRREEPDRVPYCEEYVSRPFAERLLGWPRVGERGGRPRGQRVHASTSTRRSPAPRPGQHHVRAPGAGLRREARRAGRDPLLRRRPHRARRRTSPWSSCRTRTTTRCTRRPRRSPRRRATYSAWFNTRIGIFSDDAEHGARGLQPRPVRRPSARRAAARHVRRLDRGGRRAGLPARLRRLRLDRRLRLQHGALLLARRSSASSCSPATGGSPGRSRCRGSSTATATSPRSSTISSPSGSRATHPNEPAAMDIRAVKRRYGDRLCLLGNVDLNLLAPGDARRRSTARCTT